MKRLKLYLNRPVRISGLVILFTLILAACSPAPYALPNSEGQTTPQLSGTASSSTTGAQGIPVTGGTVQAADNQKFGKILVNSEGMTLYTFALDNNPGDVNGDGIDEFGGIWHVVVVNGS